MEEELKCLTMGECLVIRYRKLGARHPLCPSKTLPPIHPYTLALIERQEVGIGFDKGKISQGEFWEKHDKADIKVNEEINLLKKEIII